MVSGERRSELTARRRILLINANTTAAITDRLTAIANAMAPAGVVFEGATGRFGARYIASRAASAIAGHAALDAFAEHGAGVDGVLLGCFGDPGLDALKEVSPVPVLGLAEASAIAALKLGGRFGVVTGGVAWRPMLTEFFGARGYGAALSGVHTITPTGAEIARDPAGAVDSLVGSCEEAIAAGAQVVILGGAGLAGLRAMIAPRVPVPVLCSVETGVQAIIAALGSPRANLIPHGPVESIALSPALAKLLG
jgi:allantoin racemase